MPNHITDLAALPSHIPVFPLSGALVFPRGRLPLHIFEPRYRTMINDARKNDGLIGMVQPHTSDEQTSSQQHPRLFNIGGLGRIDTYEETKDGRYLVTLTGICRFRIVQELSVDTPYRQVEAGYDEFLSDSAEPAPFMPIERAAIEAELQNYLTTSGLSADWEAITKSDDESLVNMLAAGCPFSFVEKQALLEAPNLAERSELLLQIMQFATGMTEQPNGETLQ